MVKIVETVASSVTSTKQHIWCNADRCEERDGSGNPSKQFFSRGQINSSTNYFYDKDHLGSIRTMSDDNGDVQASYSFDMFGRANKLEGAQEGDFQFGGYLVHARSGLGLTVARAYSAILGRFINRDPIDENGGLNLYAYVNNEPISSIDALGLQGVSWSGPYDSGSSTSSSPSMPVSWESPVYDPSPGPIVPVVPPPAAPPSGSGWTIPPTGPHGPDPSRPKPRPPGPPPHCPPPPCNDPPVDRFRKGFTPMLQCFVWCGKRCKGESEADRKQCFRKCGRLPLI